MGDYLCYLPCFSLCNSIKNPSSIRGSHAHANALDLKRCPRKCIKSVKNGCETPGIGSSSFKYSRKALPQMICKYKCRLF